MHPRTSRLVFPASSRPFLMTVMALAITTSVVAQIAADGSSGDMVPPTSEPQPAATPVATPIPLPPSNLAPPPTAEVAKKVIAGMKFIRVEPGTFMMGAGQDEAGAHALEVPAHKVTITKPFAMGTYEVTRAQWIAMMGNDPSQFTGCGLDCPVDKVSWFDAVLFANRVSDLVGLESCYDLKFCGGIAGHDFTCRAIKFKGLDCKGYRLPTEAEWEFAARAGTTTMVWSGDFKVLGERNGPGLDPVAWYSGNAGVDYEEGRRCEHWSDVQTRAKKCGTHPVGQKKPNPLGFYDIIGNLYEWTNDWYGPYAAAEAVDPLGPDAGNGKSARGAAFDTKARWTRSSRRIGEGADRRQFIIGFRLAKSE